MSLKVLASQMAMIFALSVVFAALANSQQPSAQPQPDQTAPKPDQVELGPLAEPRLRRLRNGASQFVRVEHVLEN